VALVFVDLNATDGQGNFVVLGPVTNTDTLGFGKYGDFTYSFGAYVSPRVSRQKLAAMFPRTNPGNGHQIGVLWLETDPRNPDTDGDGLSDAWEIAHGFDPLDGGSGTSLHTGKPALLVNGPLGDPDGDGRTNLEEMAFGADPRVSDVAASSATVARNNPSTVTLTWHTAVGMTYQVEYRNDILQGWQVAGSVIAGTGANATWTDDGSETGTPPTGQVRRFYRIRAVVP
jgi:hypothetical protein